MSDIHWILCTIGFMLWGYLAGYAIAAIAEHGPIRIPVITPLAAFLARWVEWYFNLNQRAVTELAGSIERLIRRK